MQSIYYYYLLDVSVSHNSDFFPICYLKEKEKLAAPLFSKRAEAIEEFTAFCFRYFLLRFVPKYRIRVKHGQYHF